MNVVKDTNSIKLLVTFVLGFMKLHDITVYVFDRMYFFARYSENVNIKHLRLIMFKLTSRFLLVLLLVIPTIPLLNDNGKFKLTS